MGRGLGFDFAQGMAAESAGILPHLFHGLTHRKFQRNNIGGFKTYKLNIITVASHGYRFFIYPGYEIARSGPGGHPDTNFFSGLIVQNNFTLVG